MRFGTRRSGRVKWERAAGKSQSYSRQKLTLADLFREVIKKASPPTERQIGPEALFRSRSTLEEERLGWNYEDNYYVTLFAEKVAEIKPVRAIRAAFIEGRPLHERAWLLDQTHVQVCVRDPGIISNLQTVTAPIPA
jgi:hypothetical protein